MDAKPSLKAVLKRLRLSGLLATLPDRAAYAEKVRMPYPDFLELALQDEIDRREQENLRRRYEECRRLALETGNKERLLVAVNNLGECDREQGDYPSARDHYEEALGLAREVGKQQFVAMALNNLGMVAAALGQTSEAQAFLREGLQISTGMQALTVVLSFMAGFAELRARADDPAGALALLGLALHHPSSDADVKNDAELVLTRLRTRVSPEEIARGLEAGEALDLDSVVDELLQTVAIPPSS